MEDNVFEDLDRDGFRMSNNLSHLQAPISMTMFSGLDLPCQEVAVIPLQTKQESGILQSGSGEAPR